MDDEEVNEQRIQQRIPGRTSKPDAAVAAQLDVR
jgi:hypothetical protein